MRRKKKENTGYKCQKAPEEKEENAVPSLALCCIIKALMEKEAKIGHWLFCVVVEKASPQRAN